MTLCKFAIKRRWTKIDYQIFFNPSIFFVLIIILFSRITTRTVSPKTQSPTSSSSYTKCRTGSGTYRKKSNKAPKATKNSDSDGYPTSRYPTTSPYYYDNCEPTPPTNIPDCDNLDCPRPTTDDEIYPTNPPITPSPVVGPTYPTGNPSPTNDDDFPGACKFLDCPRPVNPTGPPWIPPRCGSKSRMDVYSLGCSPSVIWCDCNTCLFKNKYIDIWNCNLKM